jgi:rhamnulokinase
MENAFRKVPPDEIYARTGIQFLPFNTLYQMLADAGSERKGTFLTIADYFNFRLSGRAAIEVSMASTTQLMDVHSKVWSEPLLRAFDISWELLPEIVASGTRLGAATDEPDVAVVASCSHDTGCAVAAVPALKSRGNWAFISCGTWSLMGIERAEPILSEEARLSGFTNEAGIDGTIRFLKNLSGLWPLQECAREWGNPDWEELEKEAHSAQRSSEFIDLEDASFLARGSMEERLRTYCRRHGLSEPQTRGRLARLILESIADGYRRCLTDLERVAGETCEILYLVGGGSRNRLLCELTAEKCNLPVMAGPAEATALGNLLIQARTMYDLPPKRSIRDFAFRSGELRLVSPGRQAQEYV